MRTLQLALAGVLVLSWAYITVTWTAHTGGGDLVRLATGILGYGWR